MEDVLSVYQRPYNPRRPLVCADESNKVLQCHTQKHQPMAASVRNGGQKRVDYTYESKGSANMFIFFEPLRGWRRVSVTQRRTGLDFAEQLAHLVDEDYPDADKIVLVTDNLNTHHPGVLYNRFPPQEARRIAEKLEWHYTPKHGSWLNMAEIEFSALQRQCLQARIGDNDALQAECTAWDRARNDAQVKTNWHFTTHDARIKLRRLYPVPLVIT